MSKPNAPIHSYKNPQTHYQFPGKEIFEILSNFFLANETRYINSGLDSERPKFNLNLRKLELEQLFSFINHKEYCFQAKVKALEIVCLIARIIFSKADQKKIFLIKIIFFSKAVIVCLFVWKI